MSVVSKTAMDLTMLSKLFPVWRYRKPESWIAVGDTNRPRVGASDYCPRCAKELEQLLSKFYSPKQ